MKKVTWEFTKAKKPFIKDIINNKKKKTRKIQAVYQKIFIIQLTKDIHPENEMNYKAIRDKHSINIWQKMCISTSTKQIANCLISVWKGIQSKFSSRKCNLNHCKISLHIWVPKIKKTENITYCQDCKAIWTLRSCQ